MDKQEAMIVVTAYSACTSGYGCESCPIYLEERDKIRQRVKCAAATDPERLKEALYTLRGLDSVDK